MNDLVSDVRYSLRVLRKARGFTAVVVGTLALGIGGAATIFSVVDALLLTPLPYPDADRLVMLWQGRRSAKVDRDWFSFGHFTDIQTQTHVFETLAFTEGGASTLTGRGRATEVGWVRAPSSYLRLLGAEAALGRVIDEQDDRADATAVALLTHDLWVSAFGANPGVVGQAIALDGRDIEVVGVLAPDVLLNHEVMPTAGRSGGVDIVLSFPVSADLLSDRVTEWYNILGKLAPGVELSEAQVALDSVAASIQNLHEVDPESGFFIRAVPLLDEVVGPVRRSLVVLFLSVCGVLVIACVNVANLLLARGASRRCELRVRAALGAGGSRLVGQLLAESAVLASLGGALGAALAAGGLRVVQRAGEASLPRINEIGIDGRVVMFSLAVTIATCLVFGLLPALRTVGSDLAGGLMPDTRGGTREGSLWSRFNLSNVLVGVEIGLALVLLVGGGLLGRSFMALERVDPGFRAEGVLSFRLNLSGDSYRDRAVRVAFYDGLLADLAALPGVESVGAASNVPFNGGISWGPMDIADYVPPQGEEHQIISDFRIATPGYFHTMGIPVLRGRVFEQRDDLSGAAVSVIDQNFADTYFPDVDPIGMRLVDGFLETTSTIIGVVGDVRREALHQDSRVTVYQPQRQWGARGMYVTVATQGDPTALTSAALRTVTNRASDVAVVDVATMEERVLASLAERRFAMGLLHVLGFVALVLAAVGVYGLVSYRVSQSAREISLRMALGASANRVMALVIRHGLSLAAFGIVVGIVPAVALSSLLNAMLYEVSVFDVRTYAAVALGLLLTAFIACYLPARKVTGSSPLDAISGE